MAMSTGGERGGLNSEINVTPLVDVVLVLLIIFMLTAPILQSGIEVSVPKTKSVNEITEERIVISITRAQRVFLGNDAVAPPWLVLLAFRWLAFRVEFGAGLIKLRGDACWRSLTCMDYHHETQPLPNPLSWFFHRLPRRLHRL